MRKGSKWYGNEIYGNNTVTRDFYDYYSMDKNTFVKDIISGIVDGIKSCIH